MLIHGLSQHYAIPLAPQYPLADGILPSSSLRFPIYDYVAQPDVGMSLRHVLIDVCRFAAKLKLSPCMKTYIWAYLPLKVKIPFL